MDKVITTALLIVISMVMAIVLFNVGYPATLQAGDAISNMASRSEDRMKSQIEIIHAAGELDSGTWQDTNGNMLFESFVWIKNVGSSRIIALDRMDVFFGPEGNFSRIPYQSDAGGDFPYWTFQVQNDAEWDPTATLEIAIHYDDALTTGRYYVNIVAPNGIADTLVFGM